MEQLKSMDAIHSLSHLSAYIVITLCLCFKRFLSSKTAQLGDHRLLFKYLIFETTQHLNVL
jgi:hypothetical protein